MTQQNTAVESQEEARKLYNIWQIIKANFATTSFRHQARSETAAGTRVGAVGEDCQEANGCRARQQTQQEQVDLLRWISGGLHDHARGAGLSLIRRALGQRVGLRAWHGAATQRLGRQESLRRGQQEVDGAGRQRHDQQAASVMLPWLPLND
ncbi:unnamed protein product [Polarella glacialis]|uniref:Uncharacterized protein n=1 Tax=Polarella glacialis TaxID=89957 RepID=A0A813EVV6_POLGL|nr:unnamed protein product [Polarella glacialis]